jgi:hypothetical protein
MVRLKVSIIRLLRWRWVPRVVISVDGLEQLFYVLYYGYGPLQQKRGAACSSLMRLMSVTVNSSIRRDHRGAQSIHHHLSARKTTRYSPCKAFLKTCHCVQGPQAVVVFGPLQAAAGNCGDGLQSQVLKPQCLLSSPITGSNTTPTAARQR